MKGHSWQAPDPHSYVGARVLEGSLGRQHRSWTEAGENQGHQAGLGEIAPRLRREAWVEGDAGKAQSLSNSAQETDDVLN